MPKDQKKSKPGRKPETLAVKDNWKVAVKKALAKGKPPRGK